MRRKVLIYAWMLAAAARAGDLLDRTVVRVGDRVITDSMIRRHLRMEALFTRAEPAFTPEARREAAERLIDQVLVKRELEITRYTPPGIAEAEAALERALERRTEAQLSAYFAKYGFTREEVRAEYLWRISLNRFVDFRFAPGVQVSDEEIQTYYEKEYVPAAVRQPESGSIKSLDEARAAIQQILMARKANEAMSAWLAQVRQQVEIDYIEEALRK
jgi:hypothetical protein